MTNRQCLATEQVANPDEPIFEIVDSPIPNPGPSDVLLRVLVGRKHLMFKLNWAEKILPLCAID